MGDSFDVAVVGGGISGVGVALEAAKRGKNVVLVERGTLLSQTSSNSLRIIHGGLRYLQQFHFPRVVQSLRSQIELLNLYPEHIKRLPCLMPLQSRGIKQKPFMAAAGAFYNLLYRAAGGGIRNADILSQDQVREYSPHAAHLFAQGAFLWHDAHVVHLSKFFSTLREELLERGVTLLENHTVTEVSQVSGGFALSGTSILTASNVVNVAGPWFHSGIQAKHMSAQRRPYKWAKGYNLLMKKPFPSSYALGLQGKSGRLFFLSPRSDGFAVGTWYAPFEGPADEVFVSEEEQSTALGEICELFPDLALSLSDIIDVEVGVLPMKGYDRVGDPELYGAERYAVFPGYVEVLSTKFTPFLYQARKVLTLLER